MIKIDCYRHKWIILLGWVPFTQTLHNGTDSTKQSISYPAVFLSNNGIHVAAQSTKIERLAQKKGHRDFLLVPCGAYTLIHDEIAVLDLMKLNAITITWEQIVRNTLFTSLYSNSIQHMRFTDWHQLCMSSRLCEIEDSNVCMSHVSCKDVTCFSNRLFIQHAFRLHCTIYQSSYRPFHILFVANTHRMMRSLACQTYQTLETQTPIIDAEHGKS